MGQYVDFYCGDNNKELKKIVDKIIIKNFGWIPQKDYDDFYSIAAQVVWNCENKFNSNRVKSKKFKSYLSTCIFNKVKSQVTSMNRKKRMIQDDDGEFIHNISIDAPFGDSDNLTIADTLQSDFNMDKELERKIGEFLNDNIEEFLKCLSPIQNEIVKFIMKGYSSNEIKKILNLTDQQYKSNWNSITSYENKRILYKNDNDVEECKMENANVLVEDVSETYKNTSYSIESISKQLQKKRIRDDHILQRHSGQWQRFAKSELVSDILRGKSLTQIIISEEIKNGLRMQWLIDGKQRCTTLDDYLHNGFPISKNIKNYNIRYQTTKTDENGNEVLNEDGFTEMEWKVFDIRGKKFKQLPEELQDIFKDRQIPVLYNMNCTKKDIAEDIARFNRSRTMNKAQSGWLGLDESFAEMADNIAKMQFFQPCFEGSSYTDTHHTNGSIRRIIIESIMVSDFIDDFCDFNKMCEFLSKEASDSNFTDFYAMVERLTMISNKEVSKLLNAKDSFLWFGLFSRFLQLETDDNRFLEFMTEFVKSLHSKKINNISFDDMNTGSTKDKSVVLGKMEHLEKLMCEFLDVSKKDIVVDDVLLFVKENVCQDITQEDIEFYEDCLNDFTVEVDNNTRLLDNQNHSSIISIIAYAYQKDIDIDEWFVDFFGRNSDYIRNQKDNYLHMIKDLECFTRNKERMIA